MRNEEDSQVENEIALILIILLIDYSILRLVVGAYSACSRRKETGMRPALFSERA